MCGEAARAWTEVTNAESEVAAWTVAGRYLDAFRSLGLLQGWEAGDPMPTSDLAVLGIIQHTEFDHLILRDPRIDLGLLGETGSASLPKSTRRTLVERIRVRRFMSGLVQDAHRYASAMPMLQFQVSMGDAVVRVQVPGADEHSTIPVSGAFLASRPMDDAEADYCITVMDDSITGHRRPTDFEEDWHFPLGRLDESRTGEAHIAVDRHTQTVSIFVPESRQCVVWTRNYAALPYWFVATPLRLQLSWIADRLDREFLHAAAVRIDDRAVLFAGPSGAGKSTTALMLAQVGFPLIADDFLVASDDSVQGIYRRVKVHDSHLDRIVRSDWSVLNADAPGQKRIVEPGPSLVADPTPIGCITVPRIGTRCQLQPMDPGDALSAIAPPSLSGLLGGNGASLRRIADLVSRFPCYELVLDDSVFRDPEVLNDIVEELRSRGVT